MIEIKYQTFLRRFWAGVIDSLVFIPLWIINDFIWKSHDQLPVIIMAIWYIASSLSYYIYSILMHGKYGQTLGKMATDVKVYDVSENQITMSQAIRRDIIPLCLVIIAIMPEVPKILSGINITKTETMNYDASSFIIIFVNLWWYMTEVITMLFSKKRRALHDFIAGTVVIHKNPRSDAPVATSTQRWIKVVGLSISILIMFVITILSIMLLVSFFIARPLLKMPEELNSPRVVTSLQGLTKKVFLEDVRMGDVTDIVFRNGTNGSSKEMIFFGTNGMLYTGEALPGRFVRFDKKQGRPKFIPLNSDGVYGFTNRGAWCIKAGVMDETGRVLWSYGGSGLAGVDDMASGDLDGDGIPEYAIGFGGGGGIHLLNNKGEKLWEFPDGNVWHVEIADLDGNGQKKIVHSNARGEITVRDKQGKIISRSKPKPYFSHFSLLRWPEATSPERLLLAEDNAVWIFDAGANVLAKFPAPNSGNLGDEKGALITMNNEDRALATIVDYDIWHRSILYIHDASGKLLYQEILSESCPSIAVLPMSDMHPKSFVIGCEGKVIEYKIQQ
jgi:uncharacterized RDD family membrane protein YckC